MWLASYSCGPLRRPVPQTFPALNFDARILVASHLRHALRILALRVKRGESRKRTSIACAPEMEAGLREALKLT